jgi:hypothetical protein
MTTVRIDDTMIGLKLATSPGTLTGLRYLVAGRAYGGPLTLTDDSLVARWNGVPRVLFSSDLLGMSTNKNGVLQAGYGVCIQGASISYGTLVVAACPQDAVFEVDVTSALSNAEIETQRRALIERDRWPVQPG